MTDTPTKQSTPGATITSTRQKDPKRVEQGRRLGQISKQIREQRMRERIESELPCKGWSYAGYLVGLAGLGLAAMSVYYARAQHKRDTLPDTLPEMGPNDGVIISRKKASNLDTLG